MHGRLFEQRTALQPSDLRKHTDMLDLDQKMLETCLVMDAPNAIRADVALAARLGVVGTPTFFIGRKQKDGSIELAKRINGTVSFDEIKTAVADVLIGRTSLQRMQRRFWLVIPSLGSAFGPSRRSSGLSSAWIR
jgi:hypothetical protein